MGPEDEDDEEEARGVRPEEEDIEGPMGADWLPLAVTEVPQPIELLATWLPPILLRMELPQPLVDLVDGCPPLLAWWLLLLLAWWLPPLLAWWLPPLPRTELPQLLLRTALDTVVETPPLALALRMPNMVGEGT